MKKRHISPFASTLLATALLGIGALPALAQFPPYTPATPGLDNFGADASLQGSPTNDKFELTVMPYPTNPNPPGQQETGDGYYVGLTTGYITDITTSQTSDPFWMFCVDFNGHLQTVPVTYNVVIDGLVGADNAVPDTGLGETIAKLQTQALMGAAFGTTPQYSSNDPDIQYAIWDQNNPNPSPPLPGPDSYMNALLAAAQATQSAHTADFTGAFVFDTTGADQQAFMPVNPGGFNNSNTPPTPEPGTLAMLGLGLIGLGSLKLRRSRS